MNRFFNSRYGFNVELPRKLKIRHVPNWTESGIDYIPSIVLTKNVGEERMINFVRAAKRKDMVIWPERLLYINDASKRLGSIIRWVRGKWSVGDVTVLVAPSKSRLNEELVYRTLGTEFGEDNKFNVAFPFKKNKECEIRVNPHAFTTPHSKSFLPEALEIEKRLSTSNREASTQSIGRMGFRRYFSGIYGTKDEEALKSTVGDYIIVFDDSLGEGNTIRDLFSEIRKFNSDSPVLLVTLAFDRAQDKKPNHYYLWK